MKLRNKQTGEVIILIDHIFDSYASLAQFNKEWEECEPDETKRYRLIKDLPTFKAGDEFFTDEYGSLWLDQNIDGKPNTSRVMAYHGKTIDKFPNIIEEWFEEIDDNDTNILNKEPLIKDEKIRRAVRAWAEAEGETQVQVTHCRKHILAIWTATKENGCIDFDCDIEPFDEGFYSIIELCGEEEEC